MMPGLQYTATPWCFLAEPVIHMFVVCSMFVVCQGATAWGISAFEISEEMMYVWVWHCRRQKTPLCLSACCWVGKMNRYQRSIGQVYKWIAG